MRNKWFFCRSSVHTYALYLQLILYWVIARDTTEKTKQYAPDGFHTIIEPRPLGLLGSLCEGIYVYMSV